MEFVVIALLLGTIPAMIAKHKEQNFFVWWFLGTILFPIALVMALVMGPARRCFYCDQGVRKSAIVCPHCGRDPLGDEDEEEAETA